MAGPARRTIDCFAVAAPGTEPLVAGELRALGIEGLRREAGGVAWRGTTRQLYTANVWSRLASRVLVGAGGFRAVSLPQLEAEAARLEWGSWIGPGVRPVLRVHASSGSPLFHTGAIAERIARVAGGTDDPDAPEQLVVVRVRGERVEISVDSSGEHLHRRGWRLATAKAPLRETLAAALLVAGGWRPGDALVDPFCGSGPIVVEAALASLGLAPGRDRAFAFSRWPAFEPGTWASVRAGVLDAERRAEDVVTAPLWGSDRDDGAVAAARANAERAGVGHAVTFTCAAVSDAVAPDGAAAPGWLVANPPYGGRVGDGDLRNLYARFGDVARTRFAGWGVALLVADARLAAHTGLPGRVVLRTANGGIGVVVWATGVSGPGRS